MFFSVRTPVKIGNKKYRTCICYELTDELKLTVKKLVEEGKADIYEKEVFFCTGKLVGKKAVPVELEALREEALPEEVMEAEEVKEEVKETPKSKKNKKHKDITDGF